MADDRRDSETVSQYVTDIDNIGHILGMVLNSFPSYLSSGDEHMLAIVPFITNRSKDFCSAEKNGSIIIGQDPSMQGAFGIVGPLYFNNGSTLSKIFVHGISFESYDGRRKCSNVHACKWITHPVEVLVKTSKVPQTIYMDIRPSSVLENITLYESNDSLHESIVGGLASYLYDLGVAPCVSKYFGYYACKTDEFSLPGYNTSLVIEKSSIPLIDALGGDGVGKADQAKSEWENSVGQRIFATLSVRDLIIWSCHLARTLFVLKYYFGIVHFDCHLANVLLTVMTDKFNDETAGDDDYSSIQVIYGGKLLNEVEYMSYALPNGKRMILQNNHLLVKLIDFGLTVADFPSSHVNNTMPARFVNTEPDKVPGYFNSLDDRNGYGDADYNYFVYCMVFQLYKASHNIGNFGLNTDERVKAGILYEGYLDFARNTVANFSLDQVISVDVGREDISYDVAKALDNPYEWTFHARNVGTTSKIEQPLLNIYNYLVRRGFATADGDIAVNLVGNFEGLTEATSILGVGYTSDCSSDGTGFLGCPTESAFISRTKEYLQSCKSGAVLNDADRLKCRKLNLVRISSNPANVFTYPIAPRDITTVSGLWDRRTNRLRRGIKRQDLSDYLVLNASPHFHMFKVDIPDVAFEAPSSSSSSSEIKHAIHLIYMSSTAITKLHRVKSSKDAYIVAAAQNGVSIMGGLFTKHIPYGLLKMDDVQVNNSVSYDIKNVVVMSNGRGLKFIPYASGQRYPNFKFAFTAPLVINDGKILPSMLSVSSETKPQALLGETTDGKILYIAVEGESINSPGLTFNQTLELGVHFNMRIAVHFSLGFDTNGLITHNGETKWIMPSNMYSSAVDTSSLVLSLG